MTQPRLYVCESDADMSMKTKKIWGTWTNANNYWDKKPVLSQGDRAMPL